MFHMERYSRNTLIIIIVIIVIIIQETEEGREGGGNHFIWINFIMRKSVLGSGLIW